ncbi:hypothetical protein CUMW_189020 [Citrus unshiu]|nr:hypothetical protein CUMW_189020 [Citrus unshiu]
MTLTSTDTWFFLLMWQNCFPRIVSFLKLNGVQLEFSRRGWVHYAIHPPEPHIMLFRRPLNYQQQQENQAQQNILAK